MLLRILVLARDKREARTKADDICYTLQRAGEIDYYVFFDENEPLSGRNRWGPLPCVVPYESRLGKRLVKKGIKATWLEFYSGYKKVKKFLKEFTARELFEGKVFSKRNRVKKLVNKLTNKREDFFEFEMGLWQLERGRHFRWVVGPEGVPVRNFTELERLFKVWTPNKGETWWVVPVDVHY